MCDYYTKHLKHVATLPTGHIGYIEVPITNGKPKFDQVNDINNLIHNVIHTYHPESTEQSPQTNYIVHYDDPTIHPPQFSLHQLYMTNSYMPHQTSPLYNLQPTSHTSTTRIFPSLPYTSENLILNKFNFQFSDLTDTEYITLCIMLPKKPVMQLTKMMLVHFLLPFVLDSKLMLNLFHNVLLKYRYIIETNSTLFSKN